MDSLLFITFHSTLVSGYFLLCYVFIGVLLIVRRCVHLVMIVANLNSSAFKYSEILKDLWED